MVSHVCFQNLHFCIFEYFHFYFLYVNILYFSPSISIISMRLVTVVFMFKLYFKMLLQKKTFYILSIRCKMHSQSIDASARSHRMIYKVTQKVQCLLHISFQQIYVYYIQIERDRGQRETKRDRERPRERKRESNSSYIMLQNCY